MSKAKYILKRIAQTVVLLWLIITFLFILFRLMPGDVTSRFLFQGASPEAVAAFKEKWGLDDPLYIQYLHYMINMLQLDAGTSMRFQTPVFEYTKMKIFNSLILVAPGITTGYIIGSLWGTILGSTSDERLERYGIGAAVFIGTIPIFFTAILAILIFSLYFNWFPSGSMMSSELVRQYQDAPWWRPYLTKDFAWHYILPFTVISLRYSYLPTLLMRTSVTEVMGQGFAYYHRITGLPTRNRLTHLAKHASLPVITFYPLSMGRAIGGLVLVEVVFNWPGIGLALVNSVLFRDYPVTQFIFMLVATFILFGNLFVDILYGIIDPRVSLGEDS